MQSLIKMQLNADTQLTNELLYGVFVFSYNSPEQNSIQNCHIAISKLLRQAYRHRTRLDSLLQPPGRHTVRKAVLFCTCFLFLFFI